MINIEFTPQRGDFTYEYRLYDKAIEIRMNNVVEMFDFSTFPDGRVEEIVAEDIAVNPILDVFINNGDITMILLKFYGEDEKEVFELGKNKMEV